MINTLLSSIFVIYPIKGIGRTSEMKLQFNFVFINRFSLSSVNSIFSMDEGSLFQFKSILGINTKMTRYVTFRVFTKFQ